MARGNESPLPCLSPTGNSLKTGLFAFWVGFTTYQLGGTSQPVFAPSSATEASNKESRWNVFPTKSEQALESPISHRTAFLISMTNRDFIIEGRYQVERRQAS